MADIPQQTVKRMIELGLNVKGGKESAAAISDVTTQFNRILALNPRLKSDFAAQAQVLQVLTSGYKTANALLIKHINDMEKQVGIMGKVSKGLGEMTSKINSFTSNFGAANIGLAAGFKLMNDYNQSLIKVSSQFTKYGKGIRDVNSEIKKLSVQTGLTRQDTMSLLGAFEKAFPTATIGNATNLFKNLKDSVGGNVEAMQEMMGFVSSMVDKFPDLEESLTRMNASDKKSLEFKSRSLFLTGQISFAESKRLRDYVSASRNAESEEQKRLDAINKIKKTFEDIALKIGEQLMPMMQKFADWLERSYKYLSDWVPIITKVVIAFKAIEISAKAIEMANAFGGGAKGSWASGAMGGGARAIGAGAAGYAASELAGGTYESTIGSDKSGMFAGLGKAHAQAGAAGLAGAAVAGPVGALIGVGVSYLSTIAKEISTLVGIESSTQKIDEKTAELAEKAANKAISGANAAAAVDPSLRAYASATERKAEIQKEMASLRNQMGAGTKAEESGVGSAWYQSVDNKQLVKMRDLKVEYASLQKSTLVDADKADKIGQQQLQMIADRKAKELEADAAANQRRVAIEAQNGLLQEQVGYINAQLEYAMKTGAPEKDLANLAQDQLNTTLALRKLKLENLEAAKQQASLDAENTAKDIAMWKQQMTTASDADKAALAKQIAMATNKEETAVASIKALQGQISQTKDLTSLSSAYLSTLKNIATQNQANTNLASAQLSVQEAMIGLADSLGAGMAASVDMRLQAITASREVVKNDQITIKNIEKSISMGKEGLAQIMIQDGTAKSVEEAREKAAKKLIELETEKANAQAKFINDQKKSAELAKQMREGYISAISAMTAGTGMFAKIMIDKDKNLGVGVALQGMATGGRATGRTSGFTESMRWNAGGGLDGRNRGGQQQDIFTGSTMSGMSSNMTEMNQNILRTTNNMINRPVSAAASAFGGNPAAASAYMQSKIEGKSAPNINISVNLSGSIKEISDNIAKQIADTANKIVGPMLGAGRANATR